MDIRSTPIQMVALRRITSFSTRRAFLDPGILRPLIERPRGGGNFGVPTSVIG